jgi:3-hydroxyisobutyrate dehydrogenase
MGLTVFNRTAERARPLVEAGARWAGTPAEAVRQADAVLSVVADDAASREVWLGQSGALAAMPAGSLAIECATLSPGWVQELHAQASQRGLRFADAPLGGGKLMAESGTLSLFVGATPEDLQTARPVFEAIAAHVLHFGPPGSGTQFKLVNNLFVAVQIAALGEALALAEALGLPMDVVGQAWTESGVTSAVAKAKLPFMLAGNYADTHFALQWMHKDLSYALHAAQSRRFEARLAALAHARYTAVLEKGLGGLDFAVVAEASRASGPALPAADVESNQRV